MKPNIAFLLVPLLYLTACGDSTKAPATTTAEQTDGLIQITQAQFSANNMQLGSIAEKEFPINITATGQIDVPPENRAVVNAIMGGYIKTTPLLEGDIVKKGQLLVTLENPEFIALQQSYMEVHQQLTALKATYERQQTMRTENITSEKNFLLAESNYKTTAAKHTGLAKQLELLHISPTSVAAGNISSIVSIYAPISGSISKVHVTKGSYVSPASPILEIINNEHIHLELSVFEKDILKLKKGQEIQFRIPEASNEAFKAEVYLVGAAMNANRTIKVHGHLINEKDNNFLTGMFVDATITINSQPQQALPSEAIVLVDEVPTVLVLVKKEGDTYYFKPQEILTDAVVSHYTAIKDKEGYTSQTQFLVKGAFGLLGI